MVVIFKIAAFLNDSGVNRSGRSRYTDPVPSPISICPRPLGLVIWWSIARVCQGVCPYNFYGVTVRVSGTSRNSSSDYLQRNFHVTVKPRGLSVSLTRAVYVFFFFYDYVSLYSSSVVVQTVLLYSSTFSRT